MIEPNTAPAKAPVHRLVGCHALNVLVACESSGTVREAFRKLGHNAWSCDLLPADDGSPHHLQMDALAAIGMQIQLRLGMPCPRHCWDIIVAHPPCTHLASSGARHFAAKRADGRQDQGVHFFQAMVASCIRHSVSWAIENPIGIMSRRYRKPDQIIQPWQYGQGETKATCLWLQNLPPLVPTNIVEGREARCHRLPPSKDRWKIRSKTYQGVADAMAQQESEHALRLHAVYLASIAQAAPAAVVGGSGPATCSTEGQ